MYDKIKDIAAINGLTFHYARRDFQNLVNDVEEGRTYLFLDPIQVQREFDDYGDLSGKVFSGTFLLLRSSDFDEEYEERYIQDIKPLIDNELSKIEKEFSCSDYSILQWNTTEVINLFSENLDGILVSYSVRRSL